MKSFIKSALVLGLLGSAGAVSAQAIIDQGTIQLGVDSLAQLNIYQNAYPSTSGTLPVGLRDLRTGYESTSPGCLCEGWGVADTTNGYSGYANNALGTGGLNFLSFVAFGSGTEAHSSGSGVRTRAHTSTGDLLITHAFTASASADLYQVLVTITNDGTVATGNLDYRRTFDFDVEPTAFSEFMTIQGTGGNITANDNGFCDSNPLAGCSQLYASGNFIDNGPSDHGANFDITFAPLDPGKSVSFLIFYGAAEDEASALAAQALVGANVYAWGQNSNDINGGNGSTFIFAFRGVGGSTVPEPASWALMIAGFGMVGAAMRRKSLVAA